MSIKVDLNVNLPALDRVLAALAKLQQGQEKIMTQLEDLKAALAAEDADIDLILAKVTAELGSIADLQTQLAAAIAAGAPDLAPLIASVQAKTTALAAALP